MYRVMIEKGNNTTSEVFEDLWQARNAFYHAVLKVNGNLEDITERSISYLCFDNPIAEVTMESIVG